MTEASIASADEAVEAARPWLLRYRGLVAAEAVWLVFAANFNVGYLWGGDSHVAYAFLRALFGSGHAGTGYQFGLALFEAPFYGVGRLLQDMGVQTIGTHPTPETAIAAGAVFYIGLGLAFTYVLLSRLGFRHPGLAATCAFFGSVLTIGFDEHHDNVFSLAGRAGTQTPGLMPRVSGRSRTYAL